LAVVACPACFGRVFAGSDHCVHCGAALLVGAQCDPGLIPVRGCPRCSGSAELAPRLVAETLLEECHRCGGVWVESTAFESLVNNRDQQTRLEAIAVPELTIDPVAPSSPAPAAPRRTQREYIPCPDCRQLMNRKNFANISGVLVDVCKPHGMWFDRGELGRIVKFVLRGGLGASRQRDVERLRSETRKSPREASLMPVFSEPVEPLSHAGWIGELVDAFFRLLR
jgi:Zn-finger nucleic acid-binding protein